MSEWIKLQCPAAAGDKLSCQPAASSKLHCPPASGCIYMIPPLYFRVFEHLLSEASQTDLLIPCRQPGDHLSTSKTIRRGENLTSIREICRWVGRDDRGNLKTPGTKTVKKILDWLAANGIIEIYPRSNNRAGTHYKIVNYEFYQLGTDGSIRPEEQPAADQQQKGEHIHTAAEEKITAEKQPAAGQPQHQHQHQYRARLSADRKKAAGEQPAAQAAAAADFSQTGIKTFKNDQKSDINRNIRSLGEARFLAVLGQVANYPLDQARDREMYRTLLQRYPELDLNEAIEHWRIYKLDRPLARDSNPRSQVNTAFKQYVRWGKCLKGGGKNGQPDAAPRDYRVTFEPAPERDYREGLPGYGR